MDNHPDLEVFLEFSYIEFIKNELRARQARNASYSLRAFARDLDISSTALSDLLNGKRQLSKKNLLKVCEALKLSPVQKMEFIQNRKTKEIDNPRLTLEEDTFRIIADWYYLAILNLAKLKNNKSHPHWVAQRLGITKETALIAIERLERLGFLEVQRGRLVRTTQALGTLRDVPSLAVKKHHADNLKLADEALHRVPVELREFSSTTMAISISQLKEAKEYLMKSKHKVASLLEKGEPDAVYVLSFQLFPLTQNKFNVTSK